jgi:hypothetical protein
MVIGRWIALDPVFRPRLDARDHPLARAGFKRAASL